MMQISDDKRFIEVVFPFKEIGAQSAKEKHIRKGNISTLHPWWARRPLSASRATAYAALIPAEDSEEILLKKRQFIIDFSEWKSSSNQRLIEQAQNDIKRAYQGASPKVLDPFAGGGSIPLEALRLGCDVYSGDLNPVAVLIQICMLDYSQRFRKQIETRNKSELLQDYESRNPILSDIIKWSEWIQNYAGKEIGSFYLQEPSGLENVAYIWSRTIPCQNPSCGVQVPLFRQFWLSRKANKKVALLPDPQSSSIKFKIVGDGFESIPPDFDPSSGTVSRAVVTCPKCGYVCDANTTRALFKNGKAKELLVAAISKTQKTGKTYRITTEKDVIAFREAEKFLNNETMNMTTNWGLNPIPDELLPPKETLGFRVQRYGILKWGDLFNARQCLALIHFTEGVRRAHKEMLRKGYEADYAKVITSYLGLMVSRMSNRMSSLARWFPQGEKIQATFDRAALAMSWDYVETNPFNNSTGGWKSHLKDCIEVIKHLLEIDSKTKASVTLSSATSIPYDDNFFDAVFTDPPYYDNVPYSHLSDYFYVWLKRAVGHLHPELFSTPLTPKKNEIVAYSHGQEGAEGGKRHFEEMLGQSFKEIHRVLKPGGVTVIVYAHKSTAGWETLVNSLLDSNLIITGAWPLHTEMSSRLRAMESAALASSIYIVARKMERKPTAIYKDVKEELETHLEEKLQSLWKEGLGGADFFIAAIGSAIEVFGKYVEVIDYEGNVVRAAKMLLEVREIATNFAVRQILRNGFSDDISNLTRFYLLFRWNYRSMKVAFDEARKLAQSCGIDLTEHWSGVGFIKKEKEFIRVLGPHERKLQELDDCTELVDVLHKSLLLWSENRREEIPELLATTNLNRTQVLWQVAQAVSETLSIQDKEKKLLDGFLAGKNGYIDHEPYEQITVEGKPAKTVSKKKRRKPAPKMDSQDEYEQEELE